MKEKVMERVKRGHYEMETKNGIPYITSELWTPKQRQGHSIHEVTYYACFKPQLPEFFIDTCSEQLDIVYDPFMGRGTTPIQAALMCRIPYGNDINPLSEMMVYPRLLTPLHKDEINQRIEHICQAIHWQLRKIKREDLLVFYHEETLKNLECIREYFIHMERSKQMDNLDRWVRMVMLTRIVGHSKGFFSRRSMPPNCSVTIEKQKKLNKMWENSNDNGRRFIEFLTCKKSRALLKDGYVRVGAVELFQKQAYDTPEIPDNTISLTVTSPPFLDTVNYKKQNWLKCWFANIDIDNVEITQMRKLDDWKKFIRKTLKELSRITKPGGYIAFEVGEIKNGTIFLDEHVLECAKGLPLEPIYVLINKHDFTKTSNCWKVSNNKKGTNTNRIVLFKNH